MGIESTQDLSLSRGSEPRREASVRDGRIAHFLIERPLGFGGMGEVYLARDCALGRRVALKLIRGASIDTRFVRSILDEARLTARLNHPNIVSIHALGECEEGPYLVLEYVKGAPLSRFVETADLSQTMSWGLQIAQAIAHAHARGVVHRDLKPANIVVDQANQVHLVDFGMAVSCAQDRIARGGTSAYMAPEQWRGDPITPAVDVWAFGVLMYQLLEKRRPFESVRLSRVPKGCEPACLGAEDRGWRPPRLREGAPEPLRAMVEACLQRAPQARPSAAQLIRSLEAAIFESIVRGESTLTRLGISILKGALHDKDTLHPKRKDAHNRPRYEAPHRLAPISSSPGV